MLVIVARKGGGNVLLNASDVISLQEGNCLLLLTFYYENFRPAEKLKVE